MICDDIKLGIKTNRSKIVKKSTESKTQFIGDNEKRQTFKCINFDSVVEWEQSVKADYLLIKCDSEGSRYYIELKGEKIKKAISQIEASINLIKNLSQETNYVKGFAFVVSNNINRKNFTKTDEQKEKSRFISKYKTQLFIENTPFKFDLNENKKLKK